MAARAVLPPLLADAVREALNVTLPRALAVPWHGATLDERAVLLRRGWKQALRYRVSAEAGTSEGLDPFVRDAFELLAHPRVSVELVVGDVSARRDESAIAVSDGRFALLARYDEPGLMLEAVRPTGLSSALVKQLPWHPAGRGHSASAPTEVLRKAAERAGSHRAALESELAAGGVRRDDAEVIAAVLTAPRLRTGQVCATGFALHGGAGRVVDVDLGFIDTETGRYLTQNTPSENGHHLTIAPADDARLVERIDELVSRAAELHG
jgi:ESX secretion-associated protein EspG